MKVWFKAWASEFSLGRDRQGVALDLGIELGTELGLELGDGVGMDLLDLECRRRRVRRPGRWRQIGIESEAMLAAEVYPEGA